MTVDTLVDSINAFSFDNADSTKKYDDSIFPVGLAILGSGFGFIRVRQY